MAYGFPAWVGPVLRQSHQVQARAWASVNGSAFVVPMKLLSGGSVKVDGGAQVRRSLSCSFAADVASPTVDPFSAELLVEYGIIRGLSEWWCPVGTFVVTEVKESGTQGVVNVKGEDRWRRIIDARFESPTATYGGIVAGIQTHVLGADPRMTFTDLTGSGATHVGRWWERDRAEGIVDLARSIGAQVYMRPNGSAVLAYLPPIPSPSAAATWVVGRGTGGAKITSARALTREGTYNAQVVSSEPVDGQAGAWAVARDTTSGSRTRWGGPFGKKPRFMVSNLIGNNAQAQVVADTMLSKVIGQAWSLDLVGLPRPDLEAGDSLRVEVAPNVWQTHLLDGYTLPLGLGPVTYDTRTTAAAVEAER